MLKHLSRYIRTLRHYLSLFMEYMQEHGFKAACANSVYILKILFRQYRLNKQTSSLRNKAAKGTRRHIRPGSRTSVLFISGEPSTPGHKYRINCITSCLPETLYHIQVILYGKDPLDEKKLEQGPVDVVWIWRLPWDQELNKFLLKAKSLGANIHYDVDDLMTNPHLANQKLIDGIRSMGLEENSVRQFYQRHYEMLRFSDHASSPTDALTSQMLFSHDDVWTIPNTFTSQDLILARTARQEHEHDGRFRMGYASGSRTHQKDFQTILPALCNVLADYPQATLVVYPMTLLLDEYPELARFEGQIEKRKLCPVEELVYEYARYDVNLCPLEAGNVFCECKSQLKFFEAALCKTPTIATPTDPFARFIRHAENGFLAETVDEWESSIRLLLDDASARKRIGENAYRSVLWNFSPDLLRQSVESVFVHAITPALSRQASAFSAQRVCNTSSHESIALPECVEVFSRFTHSQSRVTVVIPCYNYETYLVECLESVQNQKLQNLDVVIVDDDSTDNSLQIAESWLTKNATRFGSVKLYKNRTNSKLAKSRNAAVNLCETEFYFPLDPDNFLDSHCLDYLMTDIEKEKCGFIYPMLSSIGDARKMPHPRDWSIQQLRNGNYIDAMALIRKSTWTCVGGYTDDAAFVGWEDYDFWCKCAENALVGRLCSDAVAFYRTHPDSMLSTITDQPGYLEKAKQTMRERHPWLLI